MCKWLEYVFLQWRFKNGQEVLEKILGVINQGDASWNHKEILIYQWMPTRMATIYKE